MATRPKKTLRPRTASGPISGAPGDFHEENPIKGISSDVLLKRIKSKYKFLSKKSELSSLIKDIGFKVNITLGAGDIANEVEQIKNELEYAI